MTILEGINLIFDSKLNEHRFTIALNISGWTLAISCDSFLCSSFNSLYDTEPKYLASFPLPSRPSPSSDIKIPRSEILPSETTPCWSHLTYTHTFLLHCKYFTSEFLNLSWLLTSDLNVLIDNLSASQPQEVSRECHTRLTSFILYLWSIDPDSA